MCTYRPERFHLNGHIIGFCLQTQQLESPYKTPSSTAAVKGLRKPNIWNYEVDRDLSSGEHCPPFEQLGPVDLGPVYMEAGPPDR